MAGVNARLICLERYYIFVIVIKSDESICSKVLNNKVMYVIEYQFMEVWWPIITNRLS